MRTLTTIVWVLLGGACWAPRPPAVPVQEAASQEGQMDALVLGEDEVATVGRYRVALAKTYEDTVDGKAVSVAWVSVVEKGSTAGPQEIELGVGGALTLGERQLQVTAITLAAGDASGTVTLIERGGERGVER